MSQKFVINRKGRIDIWRTAKILIVPDTASREMPTSRALKLFAQAESWAA
jgi:hypothetical protein